MASVNTHLASYFEGRTYINGAENKVLRKLFGLKEDELSSNLEYYTKRNLVA
jgi:hypothetical protein